MKRLEYIDAAKAIAIILVIIGHCYWIDAIPRFGRVIYSFHMPLFFIISGLFWKKLDLKSAFSKYSKAYLWPYLIICLFILFADLFDSFWGNNNVWDVLKNSILKIFWASNWEKDILWGNIPRIGAAWFLFALFWACFGLNIFSRVLNQVEIPIVVMMAAIVSVVSIKVVEIPFSLQAGMLALLFVYMGSIIKKFNLIHYLMDISTRLKLLVAIFWLFVAAGVGG